jgi:hypothetical protein
MKLATATRRRPRLGDGHTAPMIYHDYLAKAVLAKNDAGGYR